MTDTKNEILEQYDARHPHSQACIDTRAKLSEEGTLKTDCIEIQRSREREWLASKLQEVARAEHDLCKQIYIEDVDWSEWGISDEEAAVHFEEEYKDLAQLKGERHE